MGSKKFKKLSLKKLTIANLEKGDLQKVQGGKSATVPTCGGLTDCTCPCAISFHTNCTES
jgi:natural product precursor